MNRKFLYFELNMAFSGSEGDNLVNVCSDRVGARVIFATDEWFACASNLLKSEEPVFDPNAFCTQGKVMDGWESRRKRIKGHDWCVIKLGFPCLPEEVVFNTRWFTGNFVPMASLDGICLDEKAENTIMKSLQLLPHHDDLGIQGTGCSVDEVERALQIFSSVDAPWVELVPKTPLSAGYEGTNLTAVKLPPTAQGQRITHVRLNYFPDGGVARLSVLGKVSCDISRSIAEREELDLCYMGNGGTAVLSTNNHFGVPSNLLQPGRGVNMGDGWETARHPSRPAIVEIDPTTGLSMSDLGDHCVLKLGASTMRINRLVIDTKFFKGNFPESVSVECCYAPSAADLETVKWQPLLLRKRMAADTYFEFKSEDLKEPSTSSEGINHLRVNIYPDGGIMRVRAFGIPLASL